MGTSCAILIVGKTFSTVGTFCEGLPMSVQFELNEKVVYPGHGVAKVHRIVEKTISGTITTFYELKFINQDMTILVPMQNLFAIGVRALSSSDSISDICRYLAATSPKIPHPDLVASNWKHRNKDYQIKLRTGSLRDISEIYRDLKYIEQYKELSFCEKNLLDRTERLIVEEIALVKKLVEEKAIEYVRSYFTSTIAVPSGHGTKITQKAL